jgi:hypothetical protein
MVYRFTLISLYRFKDKDTSYFGFPSLKPDSSVEKYQFIVYAIHGIIIPQLLKIYIRIIPLNGVYILLGYFFMILFGVFVSLVFGIILKKLFPQLYGILTGGRI